MTEPLRSLDARYYTDPAIFAIEKQHLLASTWQFAGHVSQLEKPGDFFTFSVAGENLFCIKGKDDTIRAFYNVYRVDPDCVHAHNELNLGRQFRRCNVEF